MSPKKFLTVPLTKLLFFLFFFHSFLHLKIDEENLTNELMHRCLSTKLQIVIICPTLLGLPGSFLMPQLTSILKPEKVLGLLLDVTEAKVWEIHKTSKSMSD